MSWAEYDQRAQNTFCDHGESLTINNGSKPASQRKKAEETLTERDEPDADDVVAGQSRRELLARVGDPPCLFLFGLQRGA